VGWERERGDGVAGLEGGRGEKRRGERTAPFWLFPLSRFFSLTRTTSAALLVVVFALIIIKKATILVVFVM
jgi:hypothetical protein